LLPWRGKAFAAYPAEERADGMVRRKAPLIFGEKLTEELEKLCESLGLGELNPTGDPRE
jgi:hypothetical protein